MSILSIKAQCTNCSLLIDSRWLIDEPCAFDFDRKLFIETNGHCEFGMRKTQKVRKDYHLVC